MFGQLPPDRCRHPAQGGHESGEEFIARGLGHDIVEATVVIVVALRVTGGGVQLFDALIEILQMAFATVFGGQRRHAGFDDVPCINNRP